jgi:hypothetical protein
MFFSQQNMHANWYLRHGERANSYPSIKQSNFHCGFTVKELKL